MSVDLDSAVVVSLQSIATTMKWKDQTYVIVDNVSNTRQQYLQAEVDRSGKVKTVTRLR